MAYGAFVQVADAAYVKVDGDLIYIRVQGLVTLNDLHGIIEIYRQVNMQHGRFFVLYDATRSEGIDRPARKALSAMPANNVQPIVTAAFGASFALRTLANMVDRAMVGLGRKSSGITFFSTEQQALAHIDEQRQRLLANHRFAEFQK